MDDGSLLWSMLFGAIGLGYFRYGKQQNRFVPYVSGIGLMVFPYFVTGALPIGVVGVILMALPYFVRY
jgi:hypothetical protein